MSLWKITVLTTIFFGLVATAPAEVSVATASKRVSLDYSQCIKKAKKVLREEGFESGLGNDSAAEAAQMKDGSGAAWGRQEAEPYTASIRCVPKARVVFFVVAGPTGPESLTWTYIRGLSDSFADLLPE